MLVIPSLIRLSGVPVSGPHDLISPCTALTSLTSAVTSVRLLCIPSLHSSGLETLNEPSPTQSLLPTGHWLQRWITGAEAAPAGVGRRHRAAAGAQRCGLCRAAAAAACRRAACAGECNMLQPVPLCSFANAKPHRRCYRCIQSFVCTIHQVLLLTPGIEAGGHLQ